MAGRHGKWRQNIEESHRLSSVAEVMEQFILNARNIMGTSKLEFVAAGFHQTIYKNTDGWRKGKSRKSNLFIFI